MFDEPTEDPHEQTLDPKTQASEKANEFRMHAELFSVYEGNRKFDAQILTDLDASAARDLQRRMGRLEKAKAPEHPVLLDQAATDAAEVLKLNKSLKLSTNDYHIHRRPGEVMIVRWLAGAEVESFYERFQAHFETGLNAYREEERQSKEWKQDPKTLAYLEALDAIDIRMADRYLRDQIREHHLFVLSAQSADDMNIAYLCDYIIGLPAAEIVGESSAPPDAPTDQDLAWFFKLFSLRGMIDDTEMMCFFTFLQKSDDSF